jgi:hypothetical protein
MSWAETALVVIANAIARMTPVSFIFITFSSKRDFEPSPFYAIFLMNIIKTILEIYQLFIRWLFFCGGMPDLESPWPARGNYPIWVCHTKNLHHMSNTYFLTKSYLRRIVFSYDFKDCKREKLCFEFVISPMIAIPKVPVPVN